MASSSFSSSNSNVAERRINNNNNNNNNYNNSNDDNELKYKGVRKRKWGKYVSEIRLPNSRERIWLGSYDTARKAARAFDAALFCLRGPHAKFNFPDEGPPDIPGREGLSPAQILAAAHRYANGTDDRPRDGDGELRARAARSEDCGRAGPVDLIDDWSFLDALGANGDGGNYRNAGCDFDYGLFHMYIPSPADFGEEDDDGFWRENVQSSLWSF